MTPNAPRFKLGDKVRISLQYWHTELRGAIGTIARPSECMLENDPRWSDCWRLEFTAPGEVIVYWIDFHEPWPGNDPRHPIDGAEVGEADLERW